MKSTTKLNEAPIFLTILFLVRYFKLSYDIIIDKSKDTIFLDLITISILLVFIVVILTKYFYDTPRWSKRAIEVKLKDVLEDYNKLNTLADYKYKDKFFKLTGKIKSVNSIDKEIIEIELISDDLYKVVGSTVLPKSKYKKYIQQLSKGDDVTVGCFITRGRNKIYLGIDYVFYNNKDAKKTIKGEIRCTDISLKENKMRYFFKALIYVVIICLIFSVLAYNVVITIALILILILLYRANSKYGNEKVDISNLTVDKLLEDYNKSQEDADLKYNDKYIEIDGLIESINIIDDEDININFLSDYVYTVSCEAGDITRDCLDYIKSLSKGDKLRIKADFFREDSELRLLMWYIITKQSIKAT